VANDAELGAFFESAGQALSGVQHSLAGPSADVPARLAIADAAFEVKSTLRQGDNGFHIAPITSEDLRAGGIDASLVSTVRVHLVAVADELPSAPPRRTASDVIGELRGRPDIAALDRILGGLRYETVFVPAPRRWVVRAFDASNRLLREALLRDAAD
jgi:hypothetical protein